MSAMEEVEEDSDGGRVGDGDIPKSSAVFCTISLAVSFHCPTSRTFFDMDSSKKSTFGDEDDAAGDVDAAGDENAAAVEGEEDAGGV
jgi:hypothetical protein